jgi:DNA-binding CsgD family transcriptional regulator
VTTAGIQALTEKEKETLRLLVSGYDAKSMARHLGLSVHTVNERLRDARRKLAVSSSREAARQLRDIEDRTPEIIGDKTLGEAAAAAGMEERAASVEAHRMGRPLGWIAGGLFMSFAFALLAFASMSGSPDTPAVPPATASAESPAVAAARDWLALVDRGDWNASWEATGQSFKALNTAETWARVAREVQGPLGAVKARVLLSEEAVPAPPYGYQMVRFRADYANKAGTIETLSLIREGGAWRVVGVTVE